jgi:hypothetical protein
VLAKNRPQRLRLRRHRQLAKGARLLGVSAAAALRQTGFNHLQNALGAG